MTASPGRILVLSNAAAARSRRAIPAVRCAVPPSARVEHRLTESRAQVAALVGHDRWQPDDLLVINGGDGSVQLALTALLAQCPPDRRPRVACLPAGTTNMTAFDVNAHRRFKVCLETLAQSLRGGGEVTPAPRPLVAVRRHGTPASDAHCGLFFGAGTIVQGIEYYHTRLRSRTGSGELGPGMALARTLWGIARHQPPFDEALSVAVATPRADGDHPQTSTGCTVAVRLVLATTLDRLFLGMRPFWGEGGGALRATLVERRAPAFAAHLPRLLSGHPNPRMIPRRGWHSRRLDGLTLRFDGAYTLDGELFANAGDTIDVSATEPVRFLPL